MKKVTLGAINFDEPLDCPLFDKDGNEVAAAGSRISMTGVLDLIRRLPDGVFVTQPATSDAPQVDGTDAPSPGEAPSGTNRRDADLRQIYRVRPTVEGGVEIQVKTASEVTFTGEVRDLSIQGVGATFEADQTPAVPIGARVTITLISQRLSGPCQVPGELRNRIEQGQERQYGFRLHVPDDRAEQLSAEMNRLLNRRCAIRVGPETTGMVSSDDLLVHLAAERAEASAQLRDISALGMRVRVDPVQEQLFASVEEMETRFRLPTKPDELALTTRIRHRHLDEQGLVYGMAFTRFRGQQDQIIAYVMSLQRARARRAR